VKADNVCKKLLADQVDIYKYKTKKSPKVYNSHHLQAK
jgi:hypothetical protein